VALDRSVAFLPVMDGVGEPERREEPLHRWAEHLAESVKRVVALSPGVDPDNVRHTLILLQYPPLERLRKSLIRGRATARRE
jgi:hypothetical protein